MTWKKFFILVDMIILIVFHGIVLFAPLNKDEVFICCYFFALIAILTPLAIGCFYFKNTSDFHNYLFVILSATWIMIQIFFDVIFLFFNIKLWIAVITSITIAGTFSIAFLSIFLSFNHARNIEKY